MDAEDEFGGDVYADLASTVQGLPQPAPEAAAGAAGAAGAGDGGSDPAVDDLYGDLGAAIPQIDGAADSPPRRRRSGAADPAERWEMGDDGACTKKQTWSWKPVCAWKHSARLGPVRSVAPCSSLFYLSPHDLPVCWLSCACRREPLPSGEGGQWQASAQGAQRREEEEQGQVSGMWGLVAGSWLQHPASGGAAVCGLALLGTPDPRLSALLPGCRKKSKSKDRSRERKKSRDRSRDRSKEGRRRERCAAGLIGAVVSVCNGDLPAQPPLFTIS